MKIIHKYVNYLFYFYNAIVVKIVFKDQLLLDLYTGNKINTKQFRSNPNLVEKFQLVISRIRKMDDLNQMKQYPAFRYEKLKGKLDGYSSIRLDRKYRLIFREVYFDYQLNNLKYLEIIEISNHYS
ncbi:MAG: type II toxin-antitoxin system RelE/ParE family toxin [Chitinophagaceae bacterium]